MDFVEAPKLSQKQPVLEYSEKDHQLFSFVPGLKPYSSNKSILVSPCLPPP